MTPKDSFDGLFAPEPKEQHHSLDRLPWKILLVDDEPDVHAALKLAFQTIIGEGQPVEVLEADSAAEAKKVLLQHDDIALILLDVVMESNQSGLELVQWIRDELKNQSIQIILVTGQPGYAPQNEVITRYEINGYLLKSELTNEKIYTAVHTSVRTYQKTRQLERQHRQLESSERRYRDLYDNSPDMYVSVDAETTLVTDCNQTVADKLGYSKSEIIGHPIFKLYYPDSLEGAKKTFHRFVTMGSVKNVELQLQRRDSTPLDVDLNVSAVRDDNGKIQHCRCCWIDISSRKKMESDLRLAAKVFIHASEGITLTDADGNILDTNAAFSRITGYEREEVLGKNPRIL
ncbi:MAG: PAS domain S-box protein, partial [Candidatus Thiodiazotropha sp. 'RUGA']|nr:PAS domain S-box protein [Candidatus Thiodiazotropha sp. 'RUGA']